MPLPAKESKSRVGTVVADKYRVVGELGRGGMGTIYEAVHTGIGKHVALKFLEGQIDQDAQTRARFLREAQTASMVESPHVVHIFDSGLSDDGVPFMVLELLRGENLRACLRREGRLDLELAVAIVEQTLRALVHTHAAGIVHRDLKPENIFLCDIEGTDPFIKVLDFGISKVTKSEEGSLDTLTHQGAVIGTAYYMSPEQARGESDIDGRSDIYGLGSIFYEMLTGRTPHVGNVHHAVLVEICTRDAPDVRLLAPQVPDELARIVARALNRDRDQRFPNAQAFLEALAPYALPRRHSDSLPNTDTSTLVSRPPAAISDVRTPVTAQRMRFRSGKVVASILIAALVLAAALIVVVHKRLKAERTKERAELWQSSRTSEQGSVPPTPNSSSTTVTQTGSPARSDAAPAISSHSTASRSTIRPRPSTAAAGSNHQSAPVPSSADDDLQLKTTMP